jgi:hypothetical protein
MAVTVTGLFILYEIRVCGEEVSSRFRKVAKGDYWLCLGSVVPLQPSERNTSVPAGQNFVNSVMDVFLV